MAQPRPYERITRRLVNEVVVPAAAPSIPERTATMWLEHNANRANTAARYISGGKTFPGQAQRHHFRRVKSVTKKHWSGARFPEAQYLEMRD